ncbi:MAG: hypothetical protein WCK04_02340 [Actinomycetes bacterium]
MSALAAAIGLSAVGTVGSLVASSQTKSGLGKIANTPYVDPNKAYTDSLNASLAALPQAQNLTGQENVYNQQQMQDALNKSIPGYSAIQGARSSQIQDELAGRIPPDVQAAIERSGAAHGLSGGFGGSQAGRNLTARDLGTTSLGLMNSGQQQAQQLISGTPMSTPISIAQQLGINPSLLYSGSEQQRGQNMEAAANAAVAPGALGTLGAAGQQFGGALLGYAALGNMGSRGATYNPAGAAEFNGVNVSNTLLHG